MERKVKIGLALGGGASRGMAHIGVLRAFIENSIPIDMIAGTSAGAIVGACYASRGNIADVEERVRNFFEGKTSKKIKFDFLLETVTEGGRKVLTTFRDFVMRGVFYTSSVTRRSFVDEEDFYSSISLIVDDLMIENTAIKFAAVAADIISGSPVVLEKGPLRPAVCASCAIPGVFPPVLIDKASLVDGGWVHPVPVEPLFKMGADFVIAVDISRDIEEIPKLEKGLSIIFRINAITRNVLKETQLASADHVIRPGVGSIHWADFKNYQEIVRTGHEAATAAIPAIREKIRRLEVKRQILPA